MALAKTHQAYIEAELDKDIQRELDSRSQKNKKISAKNQSTKDTKPHLKDRNTYFNNQFDKNNSEQPSQNKKHLNIEQDKLIAAKLWYALLALTVTTQHQVKKIFNRLVKKGRRLKVKLKAKQVKRQAMNQQVDLAKSESKQKLTAVDKIHHLEHSIEDSLDRGRNNTLHWIGVPSQSDFNELTHQVELLSEKVEFLEQELEQSGKPQNKINRTIIT